MMGKTKRQLRAEAVERLKEPRYENLSDYVYSMLGWGHEPHQAKEAKAGLIDLLTDDEDMDSAVCVRKCPNDEPPEGDPVHVLREASGSNVSNLLLINTTSSNDVEEAYDKLADMVERDYVRREAYDDLCDEFVWTNSFLHRVGKQCGTKDVPSLKAYVEQLEARVGELEAVDRRTAEADARREAAIRDLESMAAERDYWKSLGDNQVCGSCGRARVETHTGDARLVCWKDANCGVPVESGGTCPAWADRDGEPMGEYADVLLRRIRRIAIELDVAKVVAKRAFLVARALYDLASREAIPVEYAIQLNIIVDDLAELGVEVD